MYCKSSENGPEKRKMAGKNRSGSSSPF